mgnify:CR=1 FL=1
MTEVDEIVADHERVPEQRSGQRRLAAEVTGLVHGGDAVQAAQAASEVLFGSPVDSVAAGTLYAIAGEVATTTVGRDALDTTLLELLIRTDLVSSKGEARRALAEGSIYVNNERRSEDRIDPAADLLHGRFLLLRRGKRRYHLVAVD